MCDFRNKNILLFSVQTFNLEQEIKSKLEKLGASVDYYDERPANNNFTKGIIRLKRNIYQSRIDKYYKNILSKTNSKHYDFLLVIRGEVVPVFFLQSFKDQHPDCKLIFYTWDSINNNSHPLNIVSYFDRCFTFDPSDALKYQLNLRPLFFLDQFQKVKQQEVSVDYDLLFLGTAHSDRYSIGEYSKRWCLENGLKCYTFYYMHGRLVYLFKRLFDKSFKAFNFFKLSFKSLTLEQIIGFYKRSKIILDVNHINQKGLTMRTFEAIGSGRKLITTNKEITMYPFYNPKNILIINRDSIKLDKHFFDTSCEDLDTGLYQKLSISGWLQEIFFEPTENINWIV